MEVEVTVACLINSLVRMVPFGVDAGQSLELCIRFLVELHVGPHEPGHINVEVLVLVLDDSIDLINQTLCCAF